MAIISPVEAEKKIPLEHHAVGELSQLPHLPSRYRLKGLIGEGGMGRVFRVHDETSAMDAALKTLRYDSSNDRERFRREMQTLGQLRHENIVRLFDVGTAGDDIFFTMEFVEGVALDTFLDRPLPAKPELRWLLTVACKLLDGLEYLHSKGLIHRDVKPSNVMVVAPVGTGTLPGPDDLLQITDPTVKILDLGLARERLTVVNPKEFRSGTPLYMSPEQLTGSFAVDERSDLYSVGALLYHFITRRPPYRRLSDAIARRESPPPPHERNPACPSELSQIVLRLLERERHARPASAAELREELLSVLSEKHRVHVDRPRLLPPSFVGRDDSLRKLRHLLASAAEGKGHVVRLIGERGSGKSWLIQQSSLKGEAFANYGIAHVTGHFLEAGSLQHGLREISTDLLGILRAKRTHRDTVGALGIAGQALFSRLGLDPERPLDRVSPSGDRTPAEVETPDDIAREQCLQAAISLVRFASEEQPLLVIFEDVHNACELEREFIARCVRIAPDTPALFVMTYRPEAQRDNASFRRWIRQFDAPDVATLIDLGPLTDGEVRELGETMLRPRAPMSEELLARLVDRSEGRPLAVARTLQVLWDRQAISRSEEEWALSDDRAGRDDGDSRTHWEERLRSLDEPDLTILATAGLLRTPFDVDLLAAVVSSARSDPGGGEAIERRQILPRLRSLVARGLLVETEDGFASPADLDPSWLERRVSPERRSQLHAGAAEALLERHRDGVEHHLFRIAGHFHAAEQTKRASEFYLAAARQAAGTYANQRAREAYHHAVELAADAAAERAIAEELGEFYTRIGEYSPALDSLRRASGRGRTGGLEDELGFVATETSPRLLVKIGGVLLLQGEFDRALEVFSRCLEAGRDDPLTRAQALYRMGMIQVEQGDANAARTHLEESLRLYEELAAPERLTKVQWQLGLVEKLQGRLDRAISRFEEALDSAQRSGQEVAVAIALNNLGNIHRSQGKDHLARDCLARSIEVRERIADRPGLAISLNSLAQVHHYRGEFNSARERTEAALSIFKEVGDKKGVLIAQCNLGEARRLVGQLDSARQILEHNIELAEELKMPGIEYPCLCSLGALEIDVGDYEAAVRYLRRCLRRLPEGKFSLYRVLALGSLSVALSKREDLEEAESALEECFLILSEFEFKEKLGEIVSYRIRLELARGAVDAAVETGRQSLAGIEDGVERIGRAMLYRELGCAFRDVGPEWADQTEKYLYAALEEFEDMGSPQNIATTEADLAVYWSHQGETVEAEALLGRAEERFRKIGATGRLEELATLRSTL